MDYRKVMSDAKFYESYSRYNKEQQRYETWDESVDRVMNMHLDKYSDKMCNELKGYIELATKEYKNKLVLGAQRALQFAGPELIKHQIKMYNCTSTYCDRPAFFGEFMYMLLCGAGVGFSVQKHHIKRLPLIAARTEGTETFIVEDSIEGWAKAADVLMSSYFINGGKHPEFSGKRIYFDLNNIRPKGSEISGGFLAPGPEPLRKALAQIEHLLEAQVREYFSREIKPIVAYDICMYLADAVIAGGVRRSATICLFSPDDDEMCKAKTGSWFVDNPQRGRSNNSAVILRDEITREQFHKIMQDIKDFGEPAFVFVDDLDFTFNPLKLAA